MAEVLGVLQKCTEEREAGYLKEEALEILACMVQSSSADIPKIMSIATRHLQHKEAYIRETALRLLSTILTTHEQYTKDQEILANIKMPKSRQACENASAV